MYRYKIRLSKKAMNEHNYPIMTYNEDGQWKCEDLEAGMIAYGSSEKDAKESLLDMLGEPEEREKLIETVNEVERIQSQH